MWAMEAFPQRHCCNRVLLPQRGCPYKCRHPPAILTLPTLFLCSPLCILNNSLVHGIFVCDSFTKTATTDNLLFCRWCFFQGYAGLPAVEFAYRTLKNAEVFPDECRVSLRQLQCCVNTQRIQLFRQSASYSQTPPTGCSPSSFKIRLRFSAVSATSHRKTVAIALLPTVHF